MPSLSRDEPVLVATIVGALLMVLVEFGVPITGAQQTAVQALVVALLAFWTRSRVSPYPGDFKLPGEDDDA